MKTVPELRAELYDKTQEELEALYAAAEAGRERAAQYAEECVRRAGNRWLAIHGRLFPMMEAEFADLDAHPIPEAVPVLASERRDPL
jgi:hypothetical protein